MNPLWRQSSPLHTMQAIRPSLTTFSTCHTKYIFQIFSRPGPPAQLRSYRATLTTTRLGYDQTSIYTKCSGRFLNQPARSSPSQYDCDRFRYSRSFQTYSSSLLQKKRVSKLPPKATSKAPPPFISSENVGVEPRFIDPTAISTDTTKRIGSKQWFLDYQEKGKVSDQLEPPEMTILSRLGPSFIFTAITVAISIYYALSYVPPAPKDRMFPGLPMAITTIGSIVGLNLAVFLAWRFPPLWRTLNKYFVLSPGSPLAFGIIGSTFSHHTLWHITANMAALFLLGSTLCDQIGRGNFVALYISTGVLSSFSSLALNVFLKRFHVFGLGASGAVFGVLGGYATLNPDSKLYFILLPLVTVKAVTVATIMGTYEFVALIFGWSMALDHMAHLSGLLTGAALTAGLKEEARRRREAAVKKQLTR